MTTSATLAFLGAAGTVTGSKHLVTIDGRRVLLDCGLFQGLKALRLRNWAPPPFDPGTIDAVVLSHAHVDHSGYLPLLARRSFRGPIFCTPGTADLLPLILLDAAHLQEEEAAFANRHGYSKHHPALPLFTTDDARAALALVRPCAHGMPFAVVPGIDAVLRHAGHILGAATVELRIRGATRLVFSGDLGRPGRPILRDPEPVHEADVLLLESTYGDRTHAPDPDGALATIVCEAAARGGALVVPAFAIGRTQDLVWTLRALEAAGRIPILPVFADSPMALDATDIYRRHPEDHAPRMTALLAANEDPLRSRDFHVLRRPEESKALNDRAGPCIIVSASGMATGGRVLHHLEHRLSDPRTTVLLPGFQAAGTRGRSLQDGAPTLRMHGHDVPVRATVVTLDGFSAHADREEILGWLGGFRRPPKATWLVHGEAGAAASLAAAIRDRLGWPVEIAADGQRVAL